MERGQPPSEPLGEHRRALSVYGRGPSCYWLMSVAAAILTVSIVMGARAWHLLDTQMNTIVLARYARSGLTISVAFGIVAALLLFWSALAMLRLRSTSMAAALMAHSREQENEARLASIIRSAMEAIIVVDEAQSVVLFNPMAEKLFRCTSEHVLGAPLARLIPARYGAAHHDHVERFGKTGVSERQMGKQLRLFALRADGVEFPIEASISHTRDVHGKFYTVMLRDITERVRADDELRASREELQQLSSGIQLAREAEKTRIARELHDDLGQRLTALKMDITILEDELLANTEHGLLLSHLRGMYDLVDATVAAVRRIAADLRPVMLDDLGLGPAVEWLINDFSTRYRIAVVARIDAEAIDFKADAATTVFRIIQEALTNVARHAGASEVRIELLREDACCVLRIADDGQGARRATYRSPDSFGLLGVRERVRLLGGEVILDTAPGEGFRLMVSLPLAMVEIAGEKP
jgi:two-component system sensor histidine kinase UhpB